MIVLVLAENDLAVIRSEFTGGKTEKCAILYANQTVRPDGTVRLLAREFQFPAKSDYTRRGPLEAELSPEFVAQVTKRARREKSALVFAHSHPGLEAPTFSAVDSRGEMRLASFLSHRHPNLTHAAVVIGEGGLCARSLGTDKYIRVVSIGTHYEVLFDNMASLPSISNVFDRQVRVFGSVGQEALQGLRIAIVGVGGTGSVVAQQLVHLGVRDFILVDPDVLELTNLNRVPNSTSDDINRPKVEIAARYIQTISKDSAVTTIKGDVIYVQTAKELLNADIIFCCTDSHGSRAVLQQLSYQYMIPCIDMGVTITARDGRLTYIYGRVQLLAPGLACLICNELLDPNEVRRDMMTAFERRADPYIQGEREPAPAVMSLNSTVASLAVTMLLSVVARVPVSARHLLYNALTSTLRAVRGQPKENCYVCSRRGYFARGDAWPLMARQD